MSTADQGHCTAEVQQAAAGAIEAQHLIAGLRDGTLSTTHSWLSFATLAACHGWRSEACAAFVCELAKRASQRTSE